MEEYPEILTLEQAAQLLQVSTRTIQRLVKTGEIPGRQVGSQWRFDRDRLRQWVRGEEATARTAADQSALIARWAAASGLDLPEPLLDFQRAALKRMAAEERNDPDGDHDE